MADLMGQRSDLFIGDRAISKPVEGFGRNYYLVRFWPICPDPLDGSRNRQLRQLPRINRDPRNLSHSVDQPPKLWQSPLPWSQCVYEAFFGGSAIKDRLSPIQLDLNFAALLRKLLDLLVQRLKLRGIDRVNGSIDFSL